MKASIRIRREALLARVREVAAVDGDRYAEKRAKTLQHAAECRTEKVASLREEIAKLVAMTAEEYTQHDYRCRLPEPNDHDSVIRALEMAADDVLTVNLESDLGKYLR